MGRTREFREMVMGIHRRGLRVVLDVVYNHTFNSGMALGTAALQQGGGGGEVTHSRCRSATASLHPAMATGPTRSAASRITRSRG